MFECKQQQQHRQQQRCSPAAFLSRRKACFTTYMSLDRNWGPGILKHLTFNPVLSAAPQSRRCSPVVTAASIEASTAASCNSQDVDSDVDWKLKLLNTAFQPGQLVRLVLKAKVRGADGPVIVKPAASSAEPLEVQQILPVPTHAAALHGSESFGAVAAGTMPYKQLTMRPVLIKGQHMVQVSILTARQDITKNFSMTHAATELQQLLQLPWSSASLVTLQENVTVQISRKGKALMQVKPVAHQQQQQHGDQEQQEEDLPKSLADRSVAPEQQLRQAQVLINLQHDRVKVTPINGNVPDAFLQKIGLQSSEGRIRSNMQGKFTQINEFLKLLSQTVDLQRLGRRSSAGSNSSGSKPHSGRDAIHVLDAGCGSSHLTFGTFHYLHNVLRLPVHLTGIDTNKALMQRSNTACADLGIADVAHFHTAAIREYAHLGLPKPDIVLALHACDTATDEAMAVGVLSDARIIMSVPCCQKDIQRQFNRQHGEQSSQKATGAGGSSSSSSRSSSQGSRKQQPVQQVFAPLLDHGILRQRQLDLLTDTFRAQLLRLAGYKTDVVEFVSTEHTPRNLLIRAVKRPGTAGNKGEMELLAWQYVQLRSAWGVRPHLETLLADSLPAHVQQML